MGEGGGPSMSDKGLSKKFRARPANGAGLLWILGDRARSAPPLGPPAQFPATDQRIRG